MAFRRLSYGAAMMPMSGLDAAWVLMCTVLVLLMQAGFTCLETGLVRAKNSINVAVKNVADFSLASLVFWIAGYAIMFGPSVGGLFGFEGFLLAGEANITPERSSEMVFFFFQLAFCGTSITIVSGAVAERMSFKGYIAVTLVLSLLIYPIVGHWAWGGLAGEASSGWLEKLGFIDFAGSTVVHSVGGWVALAAVLVLGPRLGRFGEGGRAIEPHNLPIAALGMFLIWIGWFGFNGGSTLAMNDLVPVVLVHTLLAASAGGVSVMALTWALDGQPDVPAMLNGVLAGLVAVTAGAHIVSTGGAIVTGGVGGLVCVFAMKALERFEIDDAVGAVPVHLAAGVWGTLAVALFGETAFFADGAGRLEQFGIQLAGVAASGFYAFTFSYVALKLIDRFIALRVGARAEREGLNISEHGASSALSELLHRMEDQGRRGDFSHKVPVEPFTEAGEIAFRYNLVLDRFNREVKAREKDAEALREARDAAELANAAKSEFLANMSHELRTPLNAIIGFSEIMNKGMFGKLENAQYREYVRDIYNSSTHLLSLINDILDLSKIEANKMELSEEELVLADEIAACEQLIKWRTKEARLTFAVSVEENLPPLTADKRALRQMVLNLASNAVKFTPEGGKISLSVRKEVDGRIAISVSDTGIGIEKADIPKALEPFRQISTGETVYMAEGTGLGLPITAALARLHGGTFVIRSEPGNGTEVTIRLPAKRIREEQERGAIEFV